MAKPGETPLTRSPVTDFIFLYALLYGAFGASPFLPAYIQERGVPPELIGVLFGAGTAIRLISAPIAGRYPVPLKVCDETIRVLKSAVQRAKLGNTEQLQALSLGKLAFLAQS
jgi:PPP family 3-phenylpropionic acid transporter